MKLFYILAGLALLVLAAVSLFVYSVRSTDTIRVTRHGLGERYSRITVGGLENVILFKEWHVKYQDPTNDTSVSVDWSVWFRPGYKDALAIAENAIRTGELKGSRDVTVLGGRYDLAWTAEDTLLSNSTILATLLPR